MTGRIGMLAIALCVAVAAALSQDTAPGTGHPPDPGKPATDRVINFGVVGIVAGQTARLSVVFVPPPDADVPPPDADLPNPGRDLPPGPCRVALSFHFPDGRATEPKLFELPRGGSAFIDLPAQEFLLVRGKVTIIGPEKHLPPDPCRAAIEVLDSETEQTKLFVSPAEIRGFNPQPDPPGKQGRVPPGADKGFNPQPDPPGFPMIGLTRGQSLRINVANLAVPGPGGFPPDPCRAKISLLDAQGNTLVPAVQMEVKSGKSDFVVFDGAPLLGDGSVRRIQVRPNLVYVPPDPYRGALPPGPCIPVVSLELVDRATGQSSVFLSPGTIRGFNPQPDPPGTPPIIIGPEANR